MIISRRIHVKKIEIMKITYSDIKCTNQRTEHEETNAKGPVELPET